MGRGFGPEGRTVHPHCKDTPRRGTCGKTSVPAENGWPCADPTAPLQEGSDARAAVDDRVAGRCPAAGGAGVAAEGPRPGGPPVRAARLPRLDRRPRHPRHTHRSRAAHADGRQPTGHAGAALARAPASDWRKPRSPPSSRRSPRQPKAATSSWRATALQIAARSVAEKMGIPYVFAAYCPTVLPSPHHAPPPLPPCWDRRRRPQRLTTASSGLRMRERCNDMFGHRAQLPSGVARPGPGH